jgi:hypothetical protein
MVARGAATDVEVSVRSGRDRADEVLPTVRPSSLTRWLAKWLPLKPVRTVISPVPGAVVDAT